MNNQKTSSRTSIVIARIVIARIAAGLLVAILTTLIVTASAVSVQAQSRRNVFQPGEQLVYKVKFGFIKLGTVVIQTGDVNNNGKLSAHMKYATADNPFLHTTTEVTDKFDARDLTLRTFEEHTQNGDTKMDKYMSYDPQKKELTYTDEKTPTHTEGNIEPYDDALGIILNMRAWSETGVGHKYLFHVRGHDGARPVTLSFTNELSSEAVPALDDKEIPTRVVHGTMDMGGSAPLGINGDFTAYVSKDDAAIPVRIDVKIAIGSISLVLDKVKRNDWTAAK